MTACAFLLTAAPEQQPTAPAPEVSTQEDVPVFQSKVTLIEVPVVVRDKKGKAVGTLRQEDFHLFDKGKPQVIEKFSLEKSGGGRAIENVAAPGAERAPGAKSDASPVIAPDHFIGLLFDDIHINFADLAAARTAAQKFIASGLKPADRVAIFTTSGQTVLDFTDDRDLLNKTLSKLRLHPLTITSAVAKCVGMTVYQADQMLNALNPDAVAVAVAEVSKCYGAVSWDQSLAIALVSIAGSKPTAF